MENRKPFSSFLLPNDQVDPMSLNMGLEPMPTMQRNPFEDPEQIQKLLEQAAPMRKPAKMEMSEPMPSEPILEQPELLKTAPPMMEEPKQEDPKDQYNRLIREFEAIRKEDSGPKFQKLSEDLKLANDRATKGMALNTALGGIAQAFGGKVADTSGIYKQELEGAKTQAELELKNQKQIREDYATLIKQFEAANGGKGKYRFERVTGPDGDIRLVAFDESNPDIQKDLGRAGFANQVRTDAFGNIINISPSASLGEAPTMLQSSRRAPVESLKQEEIKTFRPDKEHTKAIDDEIGRLDKLSEETRKSVSASKRVLALLNSDSKLTKGALEKQIPRALGEVGNLSTFEQEGVATANDIASRLQQFVSTNVQGTLTDSNKQEVRKLIQEFQRVSADNYKNIINNSAQVIETNHAVPADFYKKSFGNVLKDIDVITKKDPTIQKYAKDYNLDYDKAESILRKRGYNGK